MKTLKKVLAVVMVLTLVVTCFAACGNKKTTYFIGATGPLTGDAKSYGESVRNGAQLAVEEINAKGGLNGVEFTFEMLDDKATEADAATGYDTLYDKGMQIALGSVTSGSCEAFAKRANEDKLFFITPSASAANVIADRPYAFRVCFGDPDQGILAAEKLTADFEKIGCIYNNGDDYSKGVYAAFEGKMKELNKAFEVRTFDNDTATDFSSQVEALKDCDVIFLPIYYTEAGLIARACVDKGYNDIFLFGCDGLDGIAAQIDETVTNRISYITPFDPNSTSDKTAAFVSAYETKYGSTPDQFAADGYDAVYIIFEAMSKAGVDDVNISAEDLSAVVAAAITAEDFTYEGVTGTMTWDETGACTKVPVIVELNK